MNAEQKLHRSRIVASVAATFICLACGTNYVYSAWAPQFAERLKLSSTESNLIGLAGNLGMYTMGVPVGIFVDHRGPRPAVLVGAVMLALGYFPLHQAYDKGSGSVPWLCFFSYVSGMGGCMANSSAVKVAALNWPNHRGTATAFPLAAFGLSAFFFSLLGSIFFPGDPSAFLMLLACGTSLMTFIGFFFLKVHPPSSYEAIPEIELEHTRLSTSEEPKPHRSPRAREPGMSKLRSSPPSTAPSPRSSEDSRNGTARPDAPTMPSSCRVTDTVDPGRPGSYESPLSTSECPSPTAHRPQPYHFNIDKSLHIDIRGFNLLCRLDFWQLFSIMGILAGVGLMTINNIGNDAKALWHHHDEHVQEKFLVQQQQIHVSIISLCSFVGRLLSGVGSDFLVKNLHASRLWCLVIACVVFFLAQALALIIEDPNLLWFVSSSSGLAYGFLFGVYPSIVTETFGIHGLSQNWGFMTLSPVPTSYLINILYGKIYDFHSVIQEGGERFCSEGANCYRGAYQATLATCFLGLGITLWVIRQQHAIHLMDHDKGEEED